MERRRLLSVSDLLCPSEGVSRFSRFVPVRLVLSLSSPINSFRIITNNSTRLFLFVFFVLFR